MLFSIMVINSTFTITTNVTFHHIRKTPNFVGRGEALSAALILRPNTSRVSAGSITPSSQILFTQNIKSQLTKYCMSTCFQR